MPTHIREATNLLLRGELIPVESAGKGRYADAQADRAFLRREIERSGRNLRIMFDPARNRICFKAERG